MSFLKLIQNQYSEFHKHNSRPPKTLILSPDRQRDLDLEIQTEFPELIRFRKTTRNKSFMGMKVVELKWVYGLEGNGRFDWGLS